MKCKFHPTVAALHYCEACDINFCEPCSDESIGQYRSRKNPESHRCFMCKTAMHPIEGVSQIEPFWNRLSQIYRYPLNLEAMITLLIIGLITAVFSNVWPVILLASVAISLYSFACLRQTANGDFDAPGLDACFDGPVSQLFYLVVVIVAAILSTMLTSNYLGTGFGILLGALYICALPAAIIIIVVEESLLPALDPSKLIGVIKATGTSYFVMLIFIFIMYSSIFAASAFFISDNSGFVSQFLFSVISNYYGIVIYHIMGYLVFQNQHSLGYSSPLSQSQEIIRNSDKLTKTELDILIKSGDYQAASRLAREGLNNPAAPLWEWSRAFTLSCIGSSEKNAADVLQKYAVKLQTVNDTEKLSSAYLTMIKHHRDYQISEPTLIMLFAKALFDNGKYKAVFNMLRNCNQHLDQADNQKEALELINKSMSALQKTVNST